MEFRIQDITDSTLAFNFSNSIDEEVSLEDLKAFIINLKNWE